MGGPHCSSPPGVSLNKLIATRNPFTKQYFEKHGEACATDVYYALSQEIERLNKERIEVGERPLTDRRERGFNRLTDKAKAEEEAWQDPGEGDTPRVWLWINTWRCA